MHFASITLVRPFTRLSLHRMQMPIQMNCCSRRTLDFQDSTCDRFPSLCHTLVIVIDTLLSQPIFEGAVIYYRLVWNGFPWLHSRDSAPGKFRMSITFGGGRLSKKQAFLAECVVLLSWLCVLLNEGRKQGFRFYQTPRSFRRDGEASY